jgi:DNA repair protein RadC
MTVIEVISLYSIPVQFSPSPEKPLSHWQLYEPGVLVQFALISHVLVDFSEHSSMSRKITIKECNFRNLKQTPTGTYMTVIEVISFYSIPVQFFPSPEKPLSHWQLYEPGVLVQFVLISHVLVDFSEHSSMSRKITKNAIPEIWTRHPQTFIWRW